jgi:hypothetical protein
MCSVKTIVVLIGFCPQKEKRKVLVYWGHLWGDRQQVLSIMSDKKQKSVFCELSPGCANRSYKVKGDFNTG